jgi:hypothetical protein
VLCMELTETGSKPALTRSGLSDEWVLCSAGRAVTVPGDAEGNDGLRGECSDTE